MAEPTQGPWRTQGWNPCWTYIPVKDACHNVVAALYPDISHGYSRDQVEANAYLIAAARDMLEALHKWKCEPCLGVGGFSDEAKCRFCDGTGIHPTARAAIAKAAPQTQRTYLT